MNRVDLLYRAKADAQRQQERALALIAVSSILRRDVLVKSEDDHTSGLSMADLTAKHLPAGCAVGGAQ